MLTRELIGRTTTPAVYDVERGHVHRFADAIGDPDPIYRDEAAARASGYERIPAPPTFAIALRPNDVREGLDIDWRKLLHGEQEFDYRRPLSVGDRVTVQQTVADVYEKAGKAGAMDFLILETTARDGAGELVFVLRSTLVIRR